MSKYTNTVAEAQLQNLEFRRTTTIPKGKPRAR